MIISVFLEGDIFNDVPDTPIGEYDTASGEDRKQFIEHIVRILGTQEKVIIKGKG